MKNQIDKFVADIKDLELTKELRRQEFYGKLTITFRKGKIVISNLEVTNRHDN